MLPNNVAGGHAVGQTSPRGFPAPSASPSPPGGSGMPIQGGTQPPSGGMGAPGTPQGGGLFPMGMEMERLGSKEHANPQEQQEIKQAAGLAKGVVDDPHILQALQQMVKSGQGQDVTGQLSAFAASIIEKLLDDVAGQGGMSGAQWLTAVLTVIGGVAQHLTKMGMELQPEQIKQFATMTMEQVKQMMVQKGMASEQELAQLSQIMQGGGAPGMAGEGGPPIAGPGSVPPGHEMVSQGPQSPPMDQQGAPPKKRARRRGSRGGTNPQKEMKQ